MNRLLPALLLSALLGATAFSTAAPAVASRVDDASARKGQVTQPLVIAHRGASGYRPEHTLPAYELAVALGADYIEPDLVMTRDGVLVDRHEPEISGTTDVADHPEFASRRTTKLLDGAPTTGWFTEDFTLAELRTLRAKERLPQLRQQNTMYDGRYRVPTFEEVLALRARLSREHGRTIGIIPEIKHSTYFHAAGLDPEAAVMKLVQKYHLDRKNAPLWVQSFELTNLLDLRTAHGFRANLVLLATNGGAPYDLSSRGDTRTYADLLTRSGLKQLAGSIDGIGPDKALVVARTPDGTLGVPTGLVAAAHEAGLQVTPWTFRAENGFLPVDYRLGTDPADFGRAVDEAVVFLETGVDGLFCDQPDVCVTARKQFLGTD